MSPNDVKKGVRRMSGRTRALTVGAVAAAALLVLLFLRGPGPAAGPEQLTYTVVEGPLVLSVTEAGTIQSRERVIVRSEVEGKNTIISLIEEGKVVKEGDLLIQLDSSELERKREDQLIKVSAIEADFVQARETLEITRSQTTMDIADAEMALRFAKIDKEKFEQGEYVSQRQEAEAAITIAREELERARETLEWSRRLAGEGYLTRTEMQADELAAKRRELDLQLAETKLKLLQNYTYPRQTEKLAADVRRAESELERVRRKSAADLLKAEVTLKDREFERTRQTEALQRLETQIAKCRVTAPAAGLVIYASTVQSRFNQDPIEVGNVVVERQELIHIPVATEMMVELRVPEAGMSNLKQGLPARIRVDALPSRVFRGTLRRISPLPDSSRSWLNPELKFYVCEVDVDAAADLRAGMGARVEIIVEEYERALYVPLQAVVLKDGKPVVYRVEGDGRAAPRPVKVGLDNNRMIHMLDGVAPGDRVLLAPPIETGGGGGPAGVEGGKPDAAKPADRPPAEKAAPRERRERPAPAGGAPGK